jgi:hypothetical protein
MGSLIDLLNSLKELPCWFRVTEFGGQSQQVLFGLPCGPGIMERDGELRDLIRGWLIGIIDGGGLGFDLCVGIEENLFESGIGGIGIGLDFGEQ